VAARRVGQARRHDAGRASGAVEAVGIGRAVLWLSNGALDAAAGSATDRARVRTPVQHGARLAHLEGVGVCQPAAGRACRAARRSGDRGVEEETLAAAQKKAQREGRTIVFIDESGLSERPTRVKTWAPRGETPILPHSFNWKQLSLIAGVTFWRFYFRFFAGAIKAPQLVEFLKALTQQIHGKLLIIWDGLPAHRSRLVRAYVESLGDRIVLERLPAYAPELNPVEYLFGYA
jgi:hypothetical protein